MRKLNKLASVFGCAALGLMVLSGCESGELYTIDSPDWLASRVDSIANNKPQGGEEEDLGLPEDVYIVGKTDYTSGWWVDFSKTYVVPDGEKWLAQFDLHINPDDNTYYKNFALIVATDVRGGANYSEYGAFRYDLTTDANAYNSNWGTVFGVINGNDFQYTDSNVKFSPEDNKDAGLQDMNGKVTLTIDRTDPNRYYMEINNGKICKTYDMPANLDAGKDIYCFLVPEGSYFEFLGSNIEPIGGYTSREDKKPLSLTLNGVAKKILQGTTIEEAFAGVTATVQFEQEVSKTVPVSELSLQTIPDMNDLGVKTLVAAYNKTYKGEYCDAVIGYAKFEIVDKLYSMVGSADNTTGWWGAHSDNIRVEPGQTYISQFTNYTSGVSNWNNFVIVLDSEDTATEYAVVRADNFGWGQGYGACIPSGGQADWGAWLSAMDGAKVTAMITNYGDGTADVKTVMWGIDGEVYYQDYIGIAVSDPDNFYFRYTVDNSHIEFDQLIGAEDNSTGWWGAHSDNWRVEPGMTGVTSFYNYTNGPSNWNNFVVVLDSEDTTTEYAVVRADNFGWGDGYGVCTTSGGQADWASWLAAMDGARVDLYVTNNGDGTADVFAVMYGNDGEEYTQGYYGIGVSDPNNFYFRLTVDGCHMVMDITK